MIPSSAQEEVELRLVRIDAVCWQPRWTYIPL